MISGILAFLSSTFLRVGLDKIFTFIDKAQDHKQELELRRLDMETARLNSQLKKEEIESAAKAGVQLIEARREADHSGMIDQMLASAVKGVDELSGVKWVDAANKFVRPFVAYWGLAILTINFFFPQHVVLSVALSDVIFSFLGLFCGGRIVSTGR